MKKTILLAGLAAAFVVILAFSTGVALADIPPDMAHSTWWAESGECTKCHFDYAALYAAHDGEVGQCDACHEFPGEPIHGQWGATVEACARCHRTHTAAGDGLLIDAPDALCLFCHGTTAGNAQTDVLSGLLRYNTGSLRGGGFNDAIMNTNNNTGGWPDGWAFPVSGVASAAVTSKHSISQEGALIWGSTEALHGSHDGADDSANLVDSTATFVTDGVEAGDMAVNLTDGSKGTITAVVDENTITATLTGGTENDWDTDDAYSIHIMWYETPDAGTATTHLECVSCHDPHAFHKTYRMLKKQPVDSSVDFHGSTEYVWVTDQLAYAANNPTSGILAYDTSDYTVVQDYISPDVYDGTGTLVLVDGEDTKYSQQLSEWCASCHRREHRLKGMFGNSREGVGSVDSGDAIFAYGHKTGDYMTSATTSGSCAYDGVACHGGDPDFNTNKNLGCLGCHVAHGTSALMTPYAQIPWPGEDATTYEGLPGTAVDTTLGTEPTNGWDLDPDVGTYGMDSRLLRLDNRGVCQNVNCHPKGTIAYLDGLTQGMDW